MLVASSSHLVSLQQQGGGTIDGKGSRSQGDEDKNQIIWKLLICNLSKLQSQSRFYP